MSVLPLLATVQHRKDDKPNQELADKIIKTSRNDWIQELVENLNHKEKNIQSDCIKTLYEMGLRGNAVMIAPYIENFIILLSSKNNRLVWGAMIALDSIASIEPAKIFAKLSEIMMAVDNGSVITIDCGVSILGKLAAQVEFASATLPLLTEQLQKCPAKQFPSYLEKSIGAINPSNQHLFLKIIEQRMQEMERDTQKKRIQKVMNTYLKKI